MSPDRVMGSFVFPRVPTPRLRATRLCHALTLALALALLALTLALALLTLTLALTLLTLTLAFIHTRLSTHALICGFERTINLLALLETLGILFHALSKPFIVPELLLQTV